VRALVVEALGPPESHGVGELPDPVAGPGEVVVGVKAAALNFPDLLMIHGRYQVQPDLPFVPGSEGSGVVVETGAGVDGVAVGDEVSFLSVTGAFAEKVSLPAARVFPKAPELSFAEAAGFTLTYATSYHALRQRADLRPGETLLVLGAAGGVGAAAVELGAVMGARVIAAASTDEKLDFAASLGAADGINYSTSDLKDAVRRLTDGVGPDVVYDPVGGHLAETALRSMAWGGRYLVIGFAAGDIPAIKLNLPLLKGLSIVGVYWGSWVEHDPAGQAANYHDLLAMVSRGDIRPRVTKSFELDEFSEACRVISSRLAMGKIVLDIA
jgi:NADPH2:quinone reductase